MAPLTHAAAVINGKGGVELQKLVVPDLGEGEVLVKVIAAALNPKDWKLATNAVNIGAVSGCDFAGLVEELGPGLKSSAPSLKVGDRVAAFVPGGETENGAFSEYVVAKAHLCITLPESWTFEQGAQVGAAVYTALQTLYQSLNLPSPVRPMPRAIPLLVYGASSGVGLYVVQVSRAAGFEVFAVCSPRNFDLVKSLGATATFDYRDPEVSSKIRMASDNNIQMAVDTISEHGSAKIISTALSSRGGKIATVLPYGKDDKAILGSNVTDEFSDACDLVYDRPGMTSRLGDVAKYRTLASQLLEAGQVKPIPIRVWEKGLEGINGAMQYMKDGKVSGQKVIFRIADTPGLAVGEKS